MSEPSKIMYSVEKFLPPICPKCDQKFDRIGEDWSPVTKESTGYMIIICHHCQNVTAKIPLEGYMLSSFEAAKKLLDQGFVNFQAGEAHGEMTQDRHWVATKEPDVEMKVVRRK